MSESPHGSIFCQTPFLDAWGEDVDLLLVEEDGCTQLGAVVNKCKGPPNGALYPAFLYQGVMFGRSYAEMPVHSRAKEALRAMEFLLTELERRYDRLSFCMHPRFEDLRSFSWFHYHEPQLGQYKLDLQYTGLVNLATAADFETYLATIRGTRRYEYRRAIAQGLTVEVSHDIATLDRLHRLTFERQGLERPGGDIRLARTIGAAALSHNFGELLICRTAGGEAVSATLFFHDERCGYYMVGANDPAHRNSNGGTFLFLENVRRCLNRGLKCVDVCGINSPNRGDFKTSFNATPTPYFVATWENPGAKV